MEFIICSLIGGSDYKLIYRHYATLYFVFCVDSSESELGILDLIQVFVETLDKCFENVCELDLIFNADVVHHILAELVMGKTLCRGSPLLWKYLKLAFRRWNGATNEYVRHFGPHRRPKSFSETRSPTLGRASRNGPSTEKYEFTATIQRYETA